MRKKIIIGTALAGMLVAGGAFALTASADTAYTGARTNIETNGTDPNTWKKTQNFFQTTITTANGKVTQVKTVYIRCAFTPWVNEQTPQQVNENDCHVDAGPNMQADAAADLDTQALAVAKRYGNKRIPDYAMAFSTRYTRQDGYSDMMLRAYLKSLSSAAKKAGVA